MTAQSDFLPYWIKGTINRRNVLLNCSPFVCYEIYFLAVIKQLFKYNKTYLRYGRLKFLVSNEFLTNIGCICCIRLQWNQAYLTNLLLFIHCTKIIIFSISNVQYTFDAQIALIAANAVIRKFLLLFLHLNAICIEINSKFIDFYRKILHIKPGCCDGIVDGKVHMLAGAA